MSLVLSISVVKCELHCLSPAAGKIGRPGRLFAAKTHESTAKALQFARWHVDGKCYEGYVSQGGGGQRLYTCPPPPGPRVSRYVCS